MYTILDINFQNTPKTIGCILIKAPSGENIIIDPGPHSCLATLQAALSKENLVLGDIHKVLLTHVHLDHAGASWAFAEAGASIFVHPVAAPYIENPQKLLASATRIYQDRMQELWGEVRPISGEKIKTITNGQLFNLGDGQNLLSVYTPGHTKHHISFWQGKTLFAGDALGVKIGDGGVVPPCPPPDLEVDVWIETLEQIKKSMPEKIVLTHFGESTMAPGHHILAMQTALSAALGMVVQGNKQKLEHVKLLKEFEGFYEKLAKTSAAYPVINPPYMSLSGLERFIKVRDIH